MAITPSQWSHVSTIPESYTPSAATSGQTLVITESVIAKLSASDQSTFWSNVQNGGGDVRICTDSGGVNQLPVEVVSLDNTAQTCVIWTRKAVYVGTGDLYVFIGKAGETQPPVTDPFGRNAVWADYEVVLHLSENVSNGAHSDSTGNGYNTNLTSGSTLSTTTLNNPFGLPWPDFTKSEVLTITGSAQALNSSPMHISAWLNADVQSGANGVVGNRYDNSVYGDDNWFQFQSNAQSFVKGDSTEDFVSGAGASGVVHLSVGHDASSLQVYRNGVFVRQDTSIANALGILSEVGQDYRIGTYFSNSSSQRYDGRICEVRLARYKPSSEKVSTEYANQSDPAAFYGTPTIQTTGGGGGAVTADAAYTINAPTFTSSASVTLPAPIAGASFALASPTFSAAADASLPQPTANGAFSIASPQFSVNAEVSLPQPVASAAFTLNSPTFSASATATIPGFSASVAYSVNAPTFSTDATVTLPSPTTDVDYTVTAPTFSVDSTATLPQPTADTAFSLPAPTFAATATVTEPNFNAAVDFTVSAPVFSGNASATLPQPVADANFTVTAPTFSVVAIVGGIAIIVDEETNINQRVLSNNINAPILSTNING